MAPPGKPEARGPLTPPLYFLLRDRTSAAFDAVGVFDAGRSANLSGDAGGPAERLNGHRITATGLAALGATPLLGRLPVAAEEQTGAAPTILLSYQLWQRRFAGRADVVNQTVKVDGQPTLILGVMPEGFGLLDNSSDAWFTFGFEPSPARRSPALASRRRPLEARRLDLTGPGRGEARPRRVRADVSEPRQGMDRRAHAMARGSIRRAAPAVDDGAARRRSHAPSLVREPRRAAACAREGLARGVGRLRKA